MKSAQKDLLNVRNVVKHLDNPHTLVNIKETHTGEKCINVKNVGKPSLFHQALQYT